MEKTLREALEEMGLRVVYAGVVWDIGAPSNNPIEFKMDSYRVSHYKKYSFDPNWTVDIATKPTPNLCGGCGQYGGTGSPSCVCDPNPFPYPWHCPTCGSTTSTLCQCSKETFAKAEGRVAATQVTTVVKSSGMKCAGGCGEFNEYAEPNQTNGRYICYRCR